MPNPVRLTDADLAAMKARDAQASTDVISQALGMQRGADGSYFTSPSLLAPGMGSTTEFMGERMRFYQNRGLNPESAFSAALQELQTSVEMQSLVPPTPDQPMMRGSRGWRENPAYEKPEDQDKSRRNRYDNYMKHYTALGKRYDALAKNQEGMLDQESPSYTKVEGQKQQIEKRMAEILQRAESELPEGEVPAVPGEEAPPQGPPDQAAPAEADLEAGDEWVETPSGQQIRRSELNALLQQVAPRFGRK